MILFRPTVSIHGLNAASLTGLKQIIHEACRNALVAQKEVYGFRDEFDYDIEVEIEESAGSQANTLRRLVRRDGVWTANGLAADFRHLYAHPTTDRIHRVQTASGEHYAHESELTWEISPNIPNQRTPEGGRETL
jgi:hypothetical protein